MSATDESISADLEPVFLELGKAVFICQAFESSLCLLHAQLSHDASGEQQGSFDAAWDFHSTRTLGQLVNALRQRIELPDDVSAFFESGVKTRNAIVHGFIAKNIQRIVHPAGRLEVERELAAMKIEVKERDVLINKFLDTLIAKYGLSNTELKRQAGEQWISVNNVASGSTQ